jgi:hypothetical protein
MKIMKNEFKIVCKIVQINANAKDGGTSRIIGNIVEPIDNVPQRELLAFHTKLPVTRLKENDLVELRGKIRNLNNNMILHADLIKLVIA